MNMENNITGDSMFIKLSLVIFFIIFLVLFLPSSLNINLHLICDRYFLDIRKENGLENKIIFKLCSLLPVYNKKLFEKKKTVKKQRKNIIRKVFNNKNTLYELIRKSYIEKFVLSLGFNLEDPIINSYVNANLNTTVCMYINLNQNKFNLKRLYYQTYVGDNLAKIDLEGIIKITLTDTIKVIIKEYFKLLKEKKVKILLFKRRRDIYGRASD